MSDLDVYSIGVFITFILLLVIIFIILRVIYKFGQKRGFVSRDDTLYSYFEEKKNKDISKLSNQHEREVSDLEELYSKKLRKSKRKYLEEIESFKKDLEGNNNSLNSLKKDFDTRENELNNLRKDLENNKKELSDSKIRAMKLGMRLSYEKKQSQQEKVQPSVYVINKDTPRRDEEYVRKLKNIFKEDFDDIMLFKGDEPKRKKPRVQKLSYNNDYDFEDDDYEDNYDSYEDDDFDDFEDDDYIESNPKKRSIFRI